MPRAVAINVAANTNLPGRRGPVYGDGSFVYVPIPEREPTREPAATYADLGLGEYVPDDAVDLPVHRDPEFAGVHGAERYTYGDPNGVKAGPLSRLDPGDILLFYATLSVRADGDADAADWLPPEWGAFLIGAFEVAEAVTGDAYRRLAAEERERFGSNAHLRRETFDAAVLVRGTDGSRLFDRAVPLSTPEAGVEANRLVTDLSNDSGAGPWWRRVLRYDASATAQLRTYLDRDPSAWLEGGGAGAE
ncbi:Nmad3 family putative nucleotide modification protein [Candidatus Halobonum tyrrellensis]|uniref:Nucleotide modification associated domain-containing protein n=1 Tax=Candidatus Halobonum tyrrellensis G22 TaxID=1324957 RepID=V4HBB5_9EURY|nr:hypothetical protein [Candidatus Halobonum tyrrellensis]ESP87318.1 hypothetical protein K933_14568 [Candidatus Halobonum tyrrellensis G22]